MKNKLQEFIESKVCGFLTESDMPELLRLDRLCPVLVRCGGVRFTCGAQYLVAMVAMVEASGDYVRDVSFPVGSMERAASWVAEPQMFSQLPKTEQREIAHEERREKLSGFLRFNEGDCGGGVRWVRSGVGC